MPDKRDNKNKSIHASQILAATAIVLLVFSLCTGIYGYLKISGGEVKNTFGAAVSVTPTVQENFTDQKIKSDVKVNVGNTGYSVYVRAAVVAVWNNDDEVSSASPILGVDYTVSVNDTDWFLADDGYYYYKYPVNSGNATLNLINDCRLRRSPPDGYSLEVKIVAQTIQSAGATDSTDTPAVTDAWGISVDSATKYLIKP